MKILHVVHAYPPSIGGSQVFVQELSAYLVNHFGDEVTVLTSNARHVSHFWLGGDALPVGKTMSQGVEVIRLPVFYHFGRIRQIVAHIAYRLNIPFNDRLRTWANGSLIWGLAKRIAAHPAPVVMATAFPLQHMYAALAGAKQANKRLVLCGAIHVADEWGYARPMMFEAIQHADAYLAYTNFERDYLIAQGIKGDKIHTVGVGIDWERYQQVRQLMSPHLPVDRPPTVIAVGRQGGRKRFDFLLKAMPQVWENIPECRLHLVGGVGEMSAMIQQICEKPPFLGRVTIDHDLSNEEKIKALCAADLLVLPSLYESFGIVFLEAWACGKPVIGANFGATASLIEAGQDGLLFEVDQPHDLATKIIRLLQDKDLAERLGAAGWQKVAERFTWAKIARQIREIYTV